MFRRSRTICETNQAVHSLRSILGAAMRTETLFRRFTKFAMLSAMAATAGGCGLDAMPLLLPLTGAQFLALDETVTIPTPSSSFTGPPVGYYEILGPDSATSAWSNPQSGLAILLDPVAGLPRGKLIISDTEQQFLFFDADGRFLQGYRYQPEDKVLYVEHPNGSRPFLGDLPTAPTIGTYLYDEPHLASSADGFLASVFSASTTISDGTKENGRQLVMTLSFEFQALVDVPADPGAGRPAITTGETATWTVSEAYTLVESFSPFAIFPSAPRTPEVSP